jgi:hypothetical protein
MSTITIINNPDGSVEAHAKGCRDIARKGKRFLADSFDMTATSERQVFLDYNADFIEENDGDEENTYPIHFLPCCDLPKDDDAYLGEGDVDDEDYGSASAVDGGEEPEQKPMTKQEARRFIRRAREALREMETLVRRGGTAEDLNEWANEAVGAVVHVQSAVDADYDGQGITGITR